MEDDLEDLGTSHVSIVRFVTRHRAMAYLKKSARLFGVLSLVPLCFGMENEEGGGLYSLESLPLLSESCIAGVVAFASSKQYLLGLL